MGARVILVSGPTALSGPSGCELVPVQTAEEMRKAVMSRLPEATMVIKAAAVADFRPKQLAEQKMKRRGPMSLELEPTADIAAEVGARKSGQLLIGFAAETENALENARKKLSAKGLDAIVVNDVSQPGIGFDSDRNAVTIITTDEVVELTEAPKSEIAREVLNFVARLKKQRKVTA